MVQLSYQLLLAIGKAGGLALFSAILATSPGMLQLYHNSEDWQDHCAFLFKIGKVVRQIHAPDLHTAQPLLNEIGAVMVHLLHSHVKEMLYEDIANNYMWIFKRTALWHGVPRAWMVREQVIRFLMDEFPEKSLPFFQDNHYLARVVANRVRATRGHASMTEWGAAYLDGIIRSTFVRRLCDASLLSGCTQWLRVDRAFTVPYSELFLPQHFPHFDQVREEDE